MASVPAGSPDGWGPPASVTRGHPRWAASRRARRSVDAASGTAAVANEHPSTIIWGEESGARSRQANTNGWPGLLKHTST